MYVDKTTDKNTWPLIMYRMAFSFCRAWFSDLFIYQFHLSRFLYPCRCIRWQEGEIETRCAPAVAALVKQQQRNYGKEKKKKRNDIAHGTRQATSCRIRRQRQSSAVRFSLSLAALKRSDVCRYWFWPFSPSTICGHCYKVILSPYITLCALSFSSLLFILFFFQHVFAAV